MTGKHEVEVTERKRGTEGHEREEERRGRRKTLELPLPDRLDCFSCVGLGAKQSEQKKPNLYG